MQLWLLTFVTFMYIPRVQLYNLIGRRVRKRRTELHLTQDQLAARVQGVRRASIANLETGRQRVPLEELIRIATALDFDDYRELLPDPSELGPAPAKGRVTVDALASDPQRAPATAELMRQLSGGSLEVTGDVVAKSSFDQSP